jgi:hypothetical protein
MHSVPKDLFLLFKEVWVKYFFLEVYALSLIALNVIYALKFPGLYATGNAIFLCIVFLCIESLVIGCIFFGTCAACYVREPYRRVVEDDRLLGDDENFIEVNVRDAMTEFT